MNNLFSDLKNLFQNLPGIGPRQASRFIYSLVDFSNEDRKKMGELISYLNKSLKRCEDCFRIFSISQNNATGNICGFCDKNSARDQTKMMVLEKDSDLFNIEKSGFYNGYYFVLGNLLDPLEKNTAEERIKILKNKTAGKKNVEIILALSPSKLGEFTCEYITKTLNNHSFKITRLARGLSSGTDLEYADENTLKHALENRK